MAETKTKKAAPKRVKAKVKILGIRWLEYVPDPLDPDSGRLVPSEHRAAKGDVVVLPERNFKILDAQNAFFKDSEVAEKKATDDDATPLSQMGIPDLINWHRQTKPSANEVLEASGGDPEMARRLLEVETQATGGDPRDEVITGLAEVVSRG